MKEENKLNIKKLNETINLSNKILKIAYILAIISLAFVAILLLRQTKIIKFILTILELCSPVFIGFFIAWLFNPIVSYFEKKGINRLVSTIMIFICLICLMCLLILTIVPAITDQFKDFITTIPSMFNDIKRFIIHTFNNFSGMDGINLHSVQTQIISAIQKYINSFTKQLPTTIINIFSSTISFIGIFLVSLIIGFYMLCHFSSIKKHIFNFIPEKNRIEIRNLLHKISSTLYNFLRGVLIDATLIFVICSVVFTILGLKSPLLFALFCAVTNIIPYIGPYIGAVPAVVVGLTQSTGLGISIGIAIFIIQFIEGKILPGVAALDDK